MDRLDAEAAAREQKASQIPSSVHTLTSVAEKVESESFADGLIDSSVSVVAPLYRVQDDVRPHSRRDTRARSGRALQN